MAVSKATTEKSPEQWREGAKRARSARKEVAAQIAELIESSDMTGSSDLTIKRVRELAAAQRSGDRVALRGAAVDLAVAAALFAVGLDLTARVMREE